MLTDKYRKLIDKLVERTTARELDWKEMLSSNSFKVSFPHYSIVVSEEDRPFSEPSVKLQIIGPTGSLVDSIDELQLDDSAGGPYYLKIRELFRSARQHAMGADEAVEEILSELGE